MAEYGESEPYVGPRPFKSEERDSFFGRGVEVDELLSLVTANRVVVLYSESGAGKTSLLQAGLLPALVDFGFDRFPVARVRDPTPKSRRYVGENVYTAGVAASLGTSRDGVQRGASAPGRLWDILHRDKINNGPPQESDVPRALCLDQFEEVFTYAAERWTERRPFFEELAEALAADPLLRVVLALREEYLAHLDAYADLFPGQLEGRYRLERLRAEAALDAVKRPLEGTVWTFAPGVAEQLVEDLLASRVETLPGEVSDVPGEFVEPVQLQVVCRGLWDALRVEGGGQITSSHLRRFGNVNKALTDLYERAIRRAVLESSEEEWKLRSWFDGKILTPAGTRAIVYKGPKETEGIDNKAVDVFVEMRLLRGDFRAGSPYWYELTHDRFIKPIQESNRKRREESLSVGGERRRAVLPVFVAMLAGLCILAAPFLAGTVGSKILRVVLVIALSAAPTVLYLSFLGSGMRSLWMEYVVNLFRLDVDRPGELPEPPESSAYHAIWSEAGGRPDDVSNIYVQKFEAVYGTRILALVRGYGRGPLARDAVTVGLVFSLVSLVGWWIVLRPTESAVPIVTFTEDDRLLGSNSPLQYAFIGAYLYTLQEVIRRYLQSSLTRGVYIRGAIRIVTAVVVTALATLVLSETWSAAGAAAAGFLIGFFPVVGIRAVRQAVALVFRTTVPSLRSEYPLSGLDGMSIFYESSLLEQGIDDMQSLVTSNIVDLLLHTRIPVARLLDWIDQASLYLWLPGNGSMSRHRADGSLDRSVLRGMGVRTATDLEAAVRDGDGAWRTLPNGEGLRGIARSLERAPNLRHVRAWKQDLWKPAAQVAVVPASGEGGSSAAAPTAGESVRGAKPVDPGRVRGG